LSTNLSRAIDQLQSVLATALAYETDRTNVNIPIDDLTLSTEQGEDLRGRLADRALLERLPLDTDVRERRLRAPLHLPLHSSLCDQSNTKSNSTDEENEPVLLRWELETISQAPAPILARERRLCLATFGPTPTVKTRALPAYFCTSDRFSDRLFSRPSAVAQLYFPLSKTAITNKKKKKKTLLSNKT
jgi:hypothetical protein